MFTLIRYKGVFEVIMSQICKSDASSTTVELHEAYQPFKIYVDELSNTFVEGRAEEVLKNHFCKFGVVVDLKVLSNCLLSSRR